MQPLSRLTPATLDVLAHLLESEEPTWGLVIIKSTNRPAGTVYPVLDRLERSGWVESQWDDTDDRPGPRRRLYHLTGEGAEAAAAAVQRSRRTEAGRAARVSEAGA